MQKRNRSLRIGLGILVSLVALAILLWLIDLRDVVQAFRQMNPLYLIPALLLTLISFGTRSAGWRTILPVEISLWQVFLIVNAGYFLNTIFPFRMGEVGRAILLKPSGIDFWEAAPTIILERIFDFILAVSLFLGALPFIFNVPQGSRYAASVGGLVVMGLTALYFLVRYQERVLAWLGEKESPGSNLRGWIRERMGSILSGLSILADPVRFTRAFLWMALSWGLALVNQYLLLRAFTPQAEVLWAAFALGAVALGVSIPSSPGNIGVYEASLVAALLVFGVEQPLAFAYALISHLLNLSITTLVGSYTLVHEGFELRKLMEVEMGGIEGGKG